MKKLNRTERVSFRTTPEVKKKVTEIIEKRTKDLPGCRTQTDVLETLFLEEYERLFGSEK